MMSFGSNIQYLRNLSNMTQETLADKMDVSRQTISKWEQDLAQPDISKAILLCEIFGCSLDNIFREKLDEYDKKHSNLRVETVPSFRYIKHTVISCNPEGDAIDRIFQIAKENGVAHPRVIGWDFPHISQEQINIYHMHGYEAAWILPEGLSPKDREIFSQQEHKYAAIHIERPFENPFTDIPNAYKTLGDYMRLNGLVNVSKDVIPCFETDGDTMDVYIACK